MLSNEMKRELKKSLEHYERRVPHMYQDSNGHVTIGIGHLITSARAAESLKLLKKDGSVPSISEKNAEYEAIKAIPSNNYSSNYFNRHTTLIMPDSEIERLLDLHIFNFNREIRILFPEFSTFPQAAQFALFDMIFNLGMHELRRARWPKLHEAVRTRDWEKAAIESFRPQLENGKTSKRENRNVYVKELFLEAAEAEKMTEEES